jgi:hypothetical protein
MRSTSIGACPLRARADPRLLRFSAGATASVLAVVLLIVDVARPLGLGLLASQVAVFAFTAFVSFQWSLWAQIFARVIWPRIGAPAELEDARPPRHCANCKPSTPVSDHDRAVLGRARLGRPRRGRASLAGSIEQPGPVPGRAQPALAAPTGP